MIGVVTRNRRDGMYFGIFCCLFKAKKGGVELIEGECGEIHNAAEISDAR